MNDMTAPPSHGAPLLNLADLYPTPDAWTAEHARIKDAATALDSYKGTLGTTAAAMLAALDAISRVAKETARLYTYAALKADEDLSLAKDQERRQQAGALYTVLGEKTAWLAPEILGLGEAKVRAFERENPALSERHGFFIDNTLRAAPHTLGLEAESVLAAAGDVLQQPDSVYGHLANSELPFPNITLSNGESVRLDQSGYVQHRQSENRADRKLVFDTFWGAWKSYEGTAGAVLTADHGRRLLC
jgi:oligoendopeptidase F